MKRPTAALVCLATVSLLLVGNLWHRHLRWAQAQESAATANPAAKDGATAAQPDALEWSPGQAYPNFNLDEIVELLKLETEKLSVRKRTRSAEQLRQNIDRTQFSTRLPGPLSKEISSQELYRKSINSVFLVVGLTRPHADHPEWRTAFSTAFVVHEDGILSTSAHVFDHQDQDDAVVAFDVQGKVYPVVELLAVNRVADTCLFRIGARNLKPIPLGRNLPPGSEIRVLGHPGDSLFFFTAGHIGNYEHDEEGQVWMNVTADFGQGSSGGPVMDSAGNVVGQVSRTYTLYAGGDASNRRERFRRVQQVVDQQAPPKNDERGKVEAGEKTSGNSADPQMVFKACTPVSAIRALVK